MRFDITILAILMMAVGMIGGATGWFGARGSWIFTVSGLVLALGLLLAAIEDRPSVHHPVRFAPPGGASAQR